MLSQRLAAGALQRLLQACAACQQAVPSLAAAASSGEASTSYSVPDAISRPFSTQHGPHITRKQREARLRNRANWLAAAPFLPEERPKPAPADPVISAIPPLPSPDLPPLYSKVGRVTRQYALLPQDAFAVCEIGGSQFKVTADDVIYFPKLDGVDIDDVLSLNRVLLAGTRDATVIGRPLVPGATVVAAVEEIFKDFKVFNFKLKRRKGYKRFRGHRDQLVALRILEVNVPQVHEVPAEQRVWAAEEQQQDGGQQRGQRREQQRQARAQA